MEAPAALGWAGPGWGQHRAHSSVRKYRRKNKNI